MPEAGEEVATAAAATGWAAAAARVVAAKEEEVTEAEAVMAEAKEREAAEAVVRAARAAAQLSPRRSSNGRRDCRHHGRERCSATTCAVCHLTWACRGMEFPE